MSRFSTVTTSIIAVLALMLSSALSTESELQIGKVSLGDLAGWKEQTIFGSKKTTFYSFAQDNGRTVLQGKSVNAAAGLLFKTDIDPKTHPVISWSWKIDHTVKKGNERVKDGHDFAARLYVVFHRGFFSKNRVVEYRTKTEPLANYYAGQSKLKDITGEKPVPEVFAALCGEIDKVNNGGTIPVH